MDTFRKHIHALAHCVVDCSMYGMMECMLVYGFTVKYKPFIFTNRRNAISNFFIDVLLYDKKQKMLVVDNK